MSEVPLYLHEALFLMSEVPLYLHEDDAGGMVPDVLDVLPVLRERVLHTRERVLY